MNRILSLSLALAASTLLLIGLLAGSRSASVHAQQGEAPTPTPSAEPGPVFDIQVLPTEGKISPPKYPNLDSDLNHIVEQTRTGRLTAQAAAASAPLHLEQSVAVTLYIIEGYADAIASYLEANGASPRNIGADYIEAYIPVSLLAEASEQEGVVSIRSIVPPHPDQGSVVSGGVATHGVTSWHAAGYKGSGVKIGVIDASFKGFAGLMGSELPATVNARCHTGVGSFTASLSDCISTSSPERTRLHGTAVTEALFDVAPQADYYISDAGSYSDLLNTVRWMASQGVDVINMSFSWTFSGSGDGTSNYSNAPLKSVDTAVSGGIIWINSAGNSAKDSWYGAFADSDSDGVHQFNTAGNECNGITIDLDPLEGITAQLRWNDSWGGASKDLNLYLIPVSGGTLSLSDAVAISTRSQSGAGSHIPYERISIDYGEITDGEYCLAVTKFSGAAPSWIQLLVWGASGDLQNYVSARSIGNPAESRNSGMLAAGAARYNSASTIESFSSRGPTTDNRTKPDIVGADGGTSSTYGTWYGTSQASPHVAGLAALVKQRFPGYTPRQIASYLKNNAQGRSTVPNNTWGYGFAKLPALPTPESLSTDATLSGLMLSDVDFGTFSSDTESYTASVAYSVSQTTVTPTVNDPGAIYFIKLDGVTDADGTVSLAVGENVITIEVKAEDDDTTKTYTVTVTRAAASTDATLSGLTLSDIDIGTFASGTETYTASVANTVSQTTVTPTLNDSGAKYVIKLGGVEDEDRTVSLAVGENVITIEVTAEDDTTTKTYTVTVTRATPLSTDATLKALTLSGIDIGTFASGTESYIARVAFSVSQTTVTPTVNESGAIYFIKLDGVTDADGTVSLAVGENIITVEVTAEDGDTTKTYTVTVTRAAPPSSDATLKALSLSNVSIGTFNSVTTSYTAQVTNSVSETTVSPTVNHSGARYVINLDGVKDEDGTVSLAVGENVITIEITAEDEKTTGTYTVTVNRAEPPSTDATLKSLTLSDVDIGTFSSVTTSYTAPVANSVTQTTVTPILNDSDASYVVRLGGVTDADGTVSLAVGRNVITVRVTAEDTTITKTYIVAVTRAELPSTDATLKALTLSGIDFGSFDSTTISYTASVANSVSQTMVTPTLNDSDASYVIKIGGVTDADGTISLVVGVNIITIRVAAEDTTTTKTYTVAVTRAEPPSTDAALSALTLSGIDFGSFSSTTTSYTASVENSVSVTTVTPTVNDSGARYVIKLGGTTDSDGTVALDVGENVITVEVTAEDDDNTKTYTLTVTRAAPVTPEQKSSDASLSSLTLSGVNFGTFDSTTSSYTARVANSVSQTTVTPTVNHSEAIYVIKLGGVTDADGTVSLAVGRNIIAVQVTAEDGESTRTYTVTVTRSAPPSTDATLSALTLSGVNFGTFAPGTTSYTASVSNGVTQTRVTSTVSHSGASYVIKVGEVTDADGIVSLAVGSNVITVAVTAQDGNATRTYTVTVTRAAPLSTDATLRSLTLSGVDFGTFDSSTTTYSGQVANSVTRTIVTPTVNHSGASYVIKLGGVTDADGIVSLSVGSNIIAIVVTAADDSTTRIYNVTVTRASENEQPPRSDAPVTGELPTDAPKVNFRAPGYAHDWVEIAWAVPRDRDITRYVVQRYEYSGDGFVSSGSEPGARFAGNTNGGEEHSLRNTHVEAGTLYQYVLMLKNDGGTTIIEASTIVRTLSSDVTLSALVLTDVDIGTFDPATTDYAADVANDVLETTVTPTANHSGASYVIKLGGFEAAAGEFSLEVGDNVITVEVTAEDGETTLTYTVTIARKEPYLLNGDLPSDDPPVNFHITGYNEDEVSLAWEIPHNRGVTGYMLERYDHDGTGFAFSDWSLSGDATGGSSAAESGTGLTADSLYRYDLALKSDDGTVIIEKSLEVRTLAAGATALSADASLNALSLSGVELGPVFNPLAYHYTGSVANDVTQTAVNTALNDSTASHVVKLGGTEDADGVLDLAPEGNVITVHVTAEDGVTTRIYTVVVSREKTAEALSDDASLRALFLSGIDFGTFDSDTTSYSVNVKYGVAQTTVTPVRNDVEASHAVKLDGVEVADGEVELAFGENVITIEVTAEDGVTTKTYTVTIAREDLSLPTGELPSDDPPLSFRITSYDEDEVSLAWEIPHNRGITSYELERHDHDGAEFSSSDWTTSGSAAGGSSSTESNAGLTSDTLYRYNLTLMSDNGTSIIENSLEVRTLAIGAAALSSDQTLSALSLSGVELDPSFNSSTYRYSGSVAGDAAQTTVTATLNDSAAGYVVKLGGAEDADGAIDLMPGRNVITVHVTAEDGVTTGVYTVAVTRAKTEGALSSDSTLRSLSLSGIDYGTFVPDTTTYTAQVTNDVTQTTVTPVMMDVEAAHVIKLAGVEDTDGVIDLTVGANVITVEVTAEDGETTFTYTVTVTREEAPAPEPEPEPVETCVQSVRTDGIIEGSWDDTCLSEKDAPGGAGDRYARFYTFTLDEAADIVINLSSDEDTYLYLLNGHGKERETLHSNDDIAVGGVNLNSRLSVSLQPGSYTIEATTYKPATSGSFTLTIEGLVEAEETTPEPEPEPEADTCIGAIDGDGTIEGSWDDNCLSDKAALSGTGDRYARFYTFTLEEAAGVKITLESGEDTYLYLLEGRGRSGNTLHENDDILLGLNTNSRLSVTLQPGDYTIEATTYYAQTDGDFTLTVEGLSPSP